MPLRTFARRQNFFARADQYLMSEKSEPARQSLYYAGQTVFMGDQLEMHLVAMQVRVHVNQRANILLISMCCKSITMKMVCPIEKDLMCQTKSDTAKSVQK